MDRGEQKRGSKVVMTGFIQQIPLLYWLYCTEVCNMSSLGKISSAILEYQLEFCREILNNTSCTRNSATARQQYLCRKAGQWGKTLGSKIQSDWRSGILDQSIASQHTKVQSLPRSSFVMSIGSLPFEFQLARQQLERHLVDSSSVALRFQTRCAYHANDEGIDLTTPLSHKTL